MRGTVYGPANEAVPQPSVALVEGDRVDVLGQRFGVVDVPGHTRGHIAYVQADPAAPLLFCGDTLFSAGCGRLLGGTAAQLFASLNKLATLPAGTRVCCAHEYTVSNLRFAAAVEPDNAALVDYAEHCRRLREAGEPTLPSTMSRERDVNPFLRCSEPAVVAAAQSRMDAPCTEALAVFTTLREWKNHSENLPPAAARLPRRRFS